MDRRTNGQTARSCYKVEAHDLKRVWRFSPLICKIRCQNESSIVSQLKLRPPSVFFKCRPLAEVHYVRVWAHLKAYSKTMSMDPGAYRAAVLLLPLFFIRNMEKSPVATGLKIEVNDWYQYNRR